MSTATHSSSPVIVCEHVSVAYGREVVLHDVCLSIDRGAFLPFVGPNGAGKTTLLRAILGLLRPQQGRIITPFRTTPPGYVPQHTSIDLLYPVSVRQIVMMGLYHRLGWWRRPGSEGHRLVRQALEQFDLADHASKTFAELSGGMRQKALIARAFATGADVLIMDEPTAELDHRSEEQVLAHLSRLSREEGKTVLLAQHGLDEVADMAPLLCVVDHGQAHLARTEEFLSQRRSATEQYDRTLLRREAGSHV